MTHLDNFYTCITTTAKTYQILLWLQLQLDNELQSHHSGMADHLADHVVTHEML